MLSSVFASGRLGEFLDTRTRYLEIEKLVPGPSGRFNVDHVPFRVASGFERLLKAPRGTYVIFKARLAMAEDIGLHLVIEVEEMYREKTLIN